MSNTSSIKERPILFNAEMVRAILDGRKTQFRRIIKPQPSIDAMGNFNWNGICFGQDASGPRTQAIASPFPSSKTKRIHCPFGKPGDRLWVRETFATVVRNVGGTPHRSIAYRATDPDAAYCYTCNGERVPARWSPGLHMPRHHSRILLEVEDVWVEKLADISKQDALAEGIERWEDVAVTCPYRNYRKTGPQQMHYSIPQLSFLSLWDSIYKTDFSGNQPASESPWVWAAKFKVLP